MDWHAGFGTDRGDHVHEGWQTSDGGFIAIGENVERHGRKSNLLVIKTDSNARQEWIREIGTRKRWDFGICVREIKDGFIIGGGIYNPSSGRQERGLAKLDFFGQTIWQKLYPGSGAGAVRGIDIDEYDNVIATGYVNASREGYVFIVEEGEGFIMKTDPDGNLIWEKRLSTPQGTKVRIEKNGGFAIASTKWVYHNGRNNQDVLLIRTDSSGNEISVRNYGGDNNEHCYDFDLTTDGGFILAGHTLSYGAINWDYLLMKVDSAGKEEWVRTFGQPRGYDPKWIHDEAYGVRSTPDGGFIIAGGSGDEFVYSQDGHPAGPSDEWKAYLVKTDARGNLLWEAVYPPGSVANNAAEFIALTRDDGYVIFTDTDSESPPAMNNFGFMKIGPDTASQQK